MKLTAFLRVPAILLMVFIPGIVLAQTGIQTRTVKFPTGKSSTTISSSLKGEQIIDFIVNAQEGQQLKVTLKTSNGANYFNVMAPGATEEAIFIGSTEGNSYSGTLNTSGDYRIRVYLMRSAARRNESVKFTLTISATGGAGSKTVDATVLGTPYHAMGQLPAAKGSGAKGSIQADFAVIRKNGSAEVRVNLPGGSTYQLRFASGEWYCVSENCKVSYKRTGVDEWEVIINGTERYYIPDAVINGG